MVEWVDLEYAIKLHLILNSGNIIKTTIKSEKIGKMGNLMQLKDNYEHGY